MEDDGNAILQKQIRAFWEVGTVEKCISIIKSKSGYTLIETMICVAIVGILIVCLARFSVGLTNTFIKTKELTKEIMQEYSDVLNIRANDNLSELNNQSYLELIDSNENNQLWKYEGKHITFYKYINQD